jgi:hypothetical protein
VSEGCGGGLFIFFGNFFFFVCPKNESLVYAFDKYMPLISICSFEYAKERQRSCCTCLILRRHVSAACQCSHCTPVVPLV